MPLLLAQIPPTSSASTVQLFFCGFPFTGSCLYPLARRRHPGQPCIVVPCRLALALESCPLRAQGNMIEARPMLRDPSKRLTHRRITSPAIPVSCIKLKCGCSQRLHERTPLPRHLHQDIASGGRSSSNRRRFTPGAAGTRAAISASVRSETSRPVFKRRAPRRWRRARGSEEDGLTFIPQRVRGRRVKQPTYVLPLLQVHLFGCSFLVRGSLTDSSYLLTDSTSRSVHDAVVKSACCRSYKCSPIGPLGFAPRLLFSL
ncbi:hypothetical protein EXIGLDRAFT_39510 [Exidia glandulosa HHB12029]|uniref:Uncharacterized protein n=1 Tax=Exidia glandulosa HHB12029 TaxID=1314781 RepID=A0A165INE2_EXIGL|nr:hypothetical protein EXIGLDRAFT_39510 [Exidia glandulosa HHB12029]